jgi:hypothetical protein
MNQLDRRAIMLNHRQRHIEQLQALGYIYSNMNAIKMLETAVSALNVDECNGDITDYKAQVLAKKYTDRAKRLFGGKLPKGFMINGDPRGYALKLDNEAYDVKHPNDLPINYQDWGGYMILAPEEF